MRKRIFELYEVMGHDYVLVEVNRGPASFSQNYPSPVPDPPSFKGTGLALCGILKPGQTLEDFKANYKQSGTAKKNI